MGEVCYIYIMKKNINNKNGKIADFLFETGVLSKTPRSGFSLLGSGKQSVAEHTNRTCYIAYALASIAGGIKTEKVIEMCLFHDLTETRISDLNYLHQKYVKVDEERSIKDLTSQLPFGDKIEKILQEYELGQSYESKLAKDADQLEFILCLKEQSDIGNARAKIWMAPVEKRLKTKEAKDLVKTIFETDSDHWWYGDKNSDWWVNRGK